MGSKKGEKLRSNFKKFVYQPLPVYGYLLGCHLFRFPEHASRLQQLVLCLVLHSDYATGKELTFAMSYVTCTNKPTLLPILTLKGRQGLCIS